MKIIPIIEEKDINLFKELIPENQEIKGVYNLGLIDMDDEPLGVILCEEENYEYHITYLYVAEDCRRQGIGTFLLNELFANLAENGIVASVTATYPCTADNVDVQEFFKSNPYVNIFIGNVIYRINPADRKDFAFKEILEKLNTKKVKPIHECTKSEQNSFFNRVLKEGYIKLRDYINHRNRYTEDLCFSYKESEDIEAAVFVMEDGKSEMNVDFEYSSGDGTGFGRVLAALFTKIEKLYNNYNLYLQPINKSEVKLISGLFPKHKDKIMVATAEWDYRNPNKDMV